VQREEGICRNCGHGIINNHGTWYHHGKTFAGIEYTQTLCWFGEIRNNVATCDCMKPEPIESDREWACEKCGAKNTAKHETKEIWKCHSCGHVTIKSDIKRTNEK